ncbi:hypothetical protein CONCODRAFT_72746 [Conidiobolus coronatus NRRL 28638]|uniref:Uncharacterized protein n=1 Tax=Conidiobolus coronatus (strain ATCC 28846 / CBS 209.66 / NRRL 28638) TaxID=796925 RepID=A0A137NYK5_CONC2|nr:hypothetical protein CONCODRAFT_72746 [Conidiobolus coronatus NRRL 28638]|eukprot:KXN67751.1 hypothetical protein CONCODRAFT_72746 [Conidiobolus coronatus NRRL 28638]
MYNLLTKFTLLTALGLVGGTSRGYGRQCPDGQWCKPKPYGGCECCPIPPNPCKPPESGKFVNGKWECIPNPCIPPESGKFINGKWVCTPNPCIPPESGKFVNGKWECIPNPCKPPESGKFVDGKWVCTPNPCIPPESGKFVDGKWVCTPNPCVPPESGKFVNGKWECIPNPCIPPESGKFIDGRWVCPDPPPPKCKDIDWNYLLDGEIDQNAGTIKLRDGRVIPIKGLHSPIRIIIIGEPYDKTHNPDRLNIEIERKSYGRYVICKVWCG